MIYAPGHEFVGEKLFLKNTGCSHDAENAGFDTSRAAQNFISAVAFTMKSFAIKSTVPGSGTRRDLEGVRTLLSVAIAIDVRENLILHPLPPVVIVLSKAFCFPLLYSSSKDVRK